MTHLIDVKKLTDIRSRINQTTDGPWQRGIGNQMHDVTQLHGPKIAHVYGGFDGNFIAHARSDINYLLDLIDEYIVKDRQNDT